MDAKEYAAGAQKGMKALDVYKKEFEPVIQIYAQLQEQYDVYTEQLEAADYQYSEMTQTGTKKHPLITTLKSLKRYSGLRLSTLPHAARFEKNTGRRVCKDRQKERPDEYA